MQDTALRPTERYLRFTDRSMLALLFFTVALGGGCLSMAIWPDNLVARLIGYAPWVVAIAITVIGLGIRKATLGTTRWSSADAEADAVLNDEFRRMSMDRAVRVAFGIVMVAQIPLGLLLFQLPSFRAVMAMAAATVTLGLATLIAVFLYFHREPADGQ